MRRFARVFGAGMLGGILMMAVAFAIHRPPLDEFGWANLPNDAKVRSTLSAGLGHDSGLYVYPALVGISPSDMYSGKAYDLSIKAGPSGFVLYRATGDAVDAGRAMPEELMKTLIVATLAAFLLAQSSNLSSYFSRIVFVATIGAIASVSTHISYHAWFGFPGKYTIGRIALDLIPWLFASFLIARLLQPETQVSDEIGKKRSAASS